MMSIKTNIALIGARGVGKSTIAKLTSQNLDRPLFCMDELIQYEAHGETIESIVTNGGWAKFREIELYVLEKLSKCNHSVIDCGGGVLVEAPVEPSLEETFSERKYQKLHACAKIMYLRRPLEDLVDLVALDAHRPQLCNDYKRLLSLRLPWYEKAADLSIDLLDKSPETLCQEIIDRLDLE